MIMQVGYADSTLNIAGQPGSTANEEYLKQRLAAIAPQRSLGPAINDDLKDMGLMI